MEYTKSHPYVCLKAYHFFCPLELGAMTKIIGSHGWDICSNPIKDMNTQSNQENVIVYINMSWGS